MTQQFLFYDIETSGLNPCFDQILQFAAIRTDDQLQELDRHEYMICFNQDVIPSPEAMLTHHIPIESIMKGQNEYDAALSIHQLFNTANTISVGYNSLNFDDEFMRFTFYRNLLTPYTHQYANQCGRMDIYPITLMFYLYIDHDKLNIQWPIDDDGKLRLKLDRLNELNQWASGPSHTAMVDVEVTLALARVLQQHSKMWHYCLGYFDKAEAAKRISQLPCTKINHKNYPLCLLIEGRFGAKHAFQHAALQLGSHQHYKNQSIYLALDQHDFEDLSHDEFFEKNWSIRRKANEPPFFLPLNEHYGRHLDAQRWQLIQHNIEWLQQHPQDFIDIRHRFLSEQYPNVDNLDIDAALYMQAFPKPNEQASMNNFHRQQSPGHLRWQDLKPQTAQQRAIRLLGRHFKDSLDAATLDDFNRYLQHIYSQPESMQHNDWRAKPRRARVEVMQTILHMQQDAEPTIQQELQAVYDYCHQLPNNL